MSSHSARSNSVSIIHVTGRDDVHVVILHITKQEHVLFAVGRDQPSYYMQVPVHNPEEIQDEPRN